MSHVCRAGAGGAAMPAGEPVISSGAGQSTSVPAMNPEIVVQIPEALRGFAAGSRELRVQAASVGEAIARMRDTHTELINHICSRDGQLRPFVNVYLGSENVRVLQGMRTPLRSGDVLTILPSVAGG